MNAALQINADRIAADRKSAEDWFCGHLHKVTKVDVRAGVTTAEQRVANIRKVIAEHQLADKILGRYNDKPEDHRTFCRRALGIDIDKEANHG